MKYNVVTTLEVYDIEADSVDDAIVKAYKRVDTEKYDGDIYIASADAYEAEG